MTMPYGHGVRVRRCPTHLLRQGVLVATEKCCTFFLIPGVDQNYADTRRAKSDSRRRTNEYVEDSQILTDKVDA